MINLLQPTYLFAFLGLLIPLVIHFWNRKEGKVRKVGSIRWMKKSAQNRFSRVKFHEWFLFSLRALLISLLVLILAQPVLETDEIDLSTKKWALIDSRLTAEESFLLNQMQTLQKEGFELRNLSYEFNHLKIEDKKYLNPANKSAEVLNHWSILKSLTTLESPPQEVIVYTKGYTKNFRGNRPILPFLVTWIAIPDKEPSFFIVSATRISADSVDMKVAKSENDHTSFFSERVAINNTNSFTMEAIGSEFQFVLDSMNILLKHEQDTLSNVEVKHLDSLKVALIYSEEFEQEKFYWKTAFNVLKKYKNLPIKISDMLIVDIEERSLMSFDWIVNLTSDSILDTKLNSEKLFAKQGAGEGINNNWFIKQNVKNQDTYYINKVISTDIREKEFGSLPAALLEVYNENFDSVIFYNDRRTISVNQMRTNVKQPLKKQAVKKLELVSLENLLWIIVLILVIIERVYSIRR